MATFGWRAPLADSLGQDFGDQNGYFWGGVPPWQTPLAKILGTKIVTLGGGIFLLADISVSKIVVILKAAILCICSWHSAIFFHWALGPNTNNSPFASFIRLFSNVCGYFPKDFELNPNKWHSHHPLSIAAGAMDHKRELERTLFCTLFCKNTKQTFDPNWGMSCLCSHCSKEVQVTNKSGPPAFPSIVASQFRSPDPCPVAGLLLSSV